MNFKGVVHRNIVWFSKHYRLLSLAVLITVSVLVGSLVIGDSVRTTLIKRVSERIGPTETVVFSRNSFMSEELLNTSLFKEKARGLLLTNGFVSHDGKLIPVFIWGTDDLDIKKGEVKINTPLARELGTDDVGDLVVRLPATGLVPSGSLFVTETYTTSLRLSRIGVLEASEGGNISMKNEQALPFNLFVNRKELAEALETEGKINLILSEKRISSAELNEAWNYGLSGLSVREGGNFCEVISDRVFLQEDVSATILKNNPEPNRLFSYLANSIERGENFIPYSFITAIDRFEDEPLGKNDIILSDYAATRLQVKPGDLIEISYFTSEDLKTLKTEKLELCVSKVLPLSRFVEDKTLSAEFPGLSGVDRCTDWDSDLPIDMNLITDEDEKYWELYKTTPKALIAYDAVAPDWSNAYGNVTAIRVKGSEPNLSGLQAEMFGIQLIYPREAGLYAAKNGVDFSSLFLALGFFIIISALLLMILPLSEMLYQRKNEINLLQALGYTRKRIRSMLWRESAPIVLLFSVVGVLVGLLYTSLIMWLLATVWRGATHTEGFSVYPDSVTMIIGFAVGTGLSLCLLRFAITNWLKQSEKSRKEQSLSLIKKKIGAILSAVFTAGLVFISFLYSSTITSFMIAGVLLILTVVLWIDYWICRKGSRNTNNFEEEKLIWSSLFANRKQSVLSFLTLSIGVFIVFSVGLNRKGFADSSQLLTGIGGYSLWCETSVPVYHNLSTEAGRNKLSLTDLPENTTVLQSLRYSADEASCLNLNKVTAPTVLGIDMNALEKSDFQIEKGMQTSDRASVFKEMQTKKGKVYPALVDATVLTWSLVKNLGDTLYYEDGRGQEIGIQLIATLSNSIFQGNILIDRDFFTEIWEETTGSEVFLLKVEENEVQEVKNLLSQALSEYGISISTTNERLQEFNTVTDTYLTIFLTLGGLGLLLGIMSFIIVIRKNLTRRSDEITLYRTLGYSDQRIEQFLFRENLFVPFSAILTGVFGSLLGVSSGLLNVGVGIWLMTMFFTALFIVCVFVFVKKSVKSIMQKESL